jgi:ribonuclease HII
MATIEDQLTHTSIREVRERFATREPTRAEWDALQADPRAGVRAVVESIQSRRKREAAESRRLTTRLRYENALWEQGLELVAGCDEAGMSPLAGPVVAGAVILRKNDRIRHVDDSKVLSAKVREELAQEIRERAVCWAVGLTGPAEIDQINIYRAGLLAMRRALEGLSVRPQHVLMDARRVPEFLVPQTPIIKGDALSMTIGAASILAKTHRDGLLRELDLKYPGYGFAEHKGYPVASHVDALRRLGPCPEHRRSFAPVREALGETPRQQELF